MRPEKPGSVLELSLSWKLSWNFGRIAICPGTNNFTTENRKILVKIKQNHHRKFEKRTKFPLVSSP